MGSGAGGWSARCPMTCWRLLLIARAASENRPCPSDQELAHVYGTSSLGRARRVLSYMEERDIIVARTDLSGRRSITIPALGWTTEPTTP